MTLPRLATLSRWCVVAFAALVLGFLATGYPLLSHAQEDVNCEEPTTQSDMTACAGRDYEAADEELNAQYKATRKVLTERDKDITDGSDSAADALLTTQRAWIAYRDAQCETVGLQAQGGTMQPMLVSACLADLTTKRSEELKQLAEGF
jgi:uncharacterized protein YecT (DUF1311 family)